MKKFLYLFFTLFLINNVSATTILSHNTFININNPNNAQYPSSDLHIQDIQQKALIELTSTNDQTIYIYTTTADVTHVLDVYTTLNNEPFNYQTVTYNQVPNIYNGNGHYHGSQDCYSGTWCSFVLTGLENKYIYFEENNDIGTQYYHIVGGNIGNAPYTNLNIDYPSTLSLPFGIIGNISFVDKNINSSTYPLNNATIFLNQTLYTYSNATGYYNISNNGSLNIPNGSYDLTVFKSGFSSISSIITVTSNYSNNNFTLNFSKPLMTLPFINDTYKIKSIYSNNEYPLSLWQSPNFVWGVYRFNEFNGTDKDIEYFKPCVYDINNIFVCEFIQNRDYEFKIRYSDIFNYNLNIYHPFLTGSRNFTTEKIFISKDYIVSNDIKDISNLPQNERESRLKNYFWEAIYFMIILLFFSVIFTSGDKK